MTAASVVPLTSRVNSTRPVASTATNGAPRGGSARIFGHRERQHQGQRAPQAAPGDGELVDGADRLGEPREAEQRQEQEQHREPRGEGRDDQHGDQHRGRASRMSNSSFGTRIEASRKTSECAQKAICSQRSVRNDQL